MAPLGVLKSGFDLSGPCETVHLMLSGRLDLPHRTSLDSQSTLLKSSVVFGEYAPSLRAYAKREFACVAGPATLCAAEPGLRVHTSRSGHELRCDVAECDINSNPFIDWSMTDRRRWDTLQACLLTITSGGTVYSFGAYSNALKSQLQLSQTQITLAAFFSNLGNYVGISGFVGDIYGMRCSARIGTTLIGVGYGGLWAVTTFGKAGSSAAILVTICCFV